jgi:hypothetical protein
MMYVVNYADGGFVIVGANRGYYPVLAYSEENSFLLSEDMGGVDVWLDETQEVIRQSDSLDEETKSRINSLWRQYEPIVNEISTSVRTKGTPEQDYAQAVRIAQLNNMDYICYSLTSAYANGLITYSKYMDFLDGSDAVGAPAEYTIFATGTNHSYSQVGPFLQPLGIIWSQNTPFNNQVPLINGLHPLLGCVAVAAGQVMAYHKWPNTFNWSTMLSVGGSSIITQNFLYNLADDIDTNFGLDKSSASPSELVSEFKSTYGYSSSISFISHSTPTVHSQLSLSQPVIMTGERYDQAKKEYVGHAWVCEGYISDTYHNVWFVEYLIGGPGNYSYSSKNNYIPTPSLQNPASYSGGINHTHYMNWGHGGNYNGWFFGSYVNMNYNDRDYQHNRKDIINIKKP